MADVTIETTAHTVLHAVAVRGGIFWTSPTVGYIIFVDANQDLVYKKTEDGGAAWAAKNTLVTGTIVSYDCWADWQTPGDGGTVIHIACIDIDTDNAIYVTLDTSDDSEAIDVIASCPGTGAITGFNRDDNNITITKAKGGNIAVEILFKDTVSAYSYEFYTSPDGDTWTSKTTPREASADYVLLFPGNEADTQDLWAIYLDNSADRISLKTYDDSGDSWSETVFEVAYDDPTPYLQMDGAIRLSDGHLILANWNYYNSVNADLAVWDINGAGSITAKTDVITNTAEYALASVFINQANDDIYVAYAGGTDFTSLVKVYYKKSDDGGGSWGDQAAMQANAEGDERWISCGAVKEAWGGKFLPVWFNDDLNDLFCNTDNGISTVALPTTTILPATSITPDEARINAEVLDDAGAACEGRFGWAEIEQEDNFEWGSDGDPLDDNGGGITWSLEVAGTSVAEIEDAGGVPYAGTRCAKLHRDGTNNVRAYFTQTAGEDYNIRFRFRKDTTSAAYAVHGNGTKRIILYIDASENVKYYDEDGDLTDTGYNVTVGTWHLFEFKNLDWTAGTFDLYFDRDLIADGAEMQTDATYSNTINFFNYAGTSDIYIDNVLVTKEWTLTSFANGLTTDDPFYSDLTSLSTGTRHVYEAQLQNSAGESLWSAEATFRTAFSNKSSFFNVL